jgi:predicted acetyltransferase
MALEIKSATDTDYSVVSNLARFYIYDMAEYTGLTFSVNGLFDCKDQFANYWGRVSAKHRWPSAWRGFPFLIQIDGCPAGFSLVKSVSTSLPMFDMGEFFIARQYRRQGFGRSVARALFDHFEGSWQVREILANWPAQAFWRQIITDYTGGSFNETREVFAVYDYKEFIVQRFQTRAAKPLSGA